MHTDYASIKPTLVLINIQREYITQGPYFLEGIVPSLANCQNVLAHARRHSWSVLHVRHVTDGRVFGGTRAEPINGFASSFGEPVFVKTKISPYTNEQFKSVMLALRGSGVFVMGYGSTQCCLSTMVSGGALGLRHTFISDASWARARSSHVSEADSHRAAIDIIRIHGNVQTTAEVLAAFSAEKNPRFRGLSVKRLKS